jgi:AAA+ superfamily predicted ATPase
MAFTLDQVCLLVRSRYALQLLLTHEEHRVESQLLELTAREGMAFYRWRTTSGLIGPDGDVIPDTSSAEQALKHVIGIPNPAIFLLYDAHLAMQDPMVVRLLRDLEVVLAARTQAVLMVSPLFFMPIELEKDITIIDVPLPTAGEIAQLFDEAAARDRLVLTPEVRDQLAMASLGLADTEIRRLLARIRMSGGEFSASDIGRVIEEKKRAIRRSHVLEYYDMGERMTHVGGMENLKNWLDQRALGFSEEARRYGLPAPRGLFLLGVQGCGKSLMAKAVADLWQIPLLRLDVGAVFEVQERAELGLRNAVRVAESLAPVVLWIDELEKGLLSSREESGGRALGTFLTWMQEKTSPVFVVATANDVRALPPELMRKGRFDEIFFVDLPNVHERLAIVEIHLRRRGRDPEKFDLTLMAEETDRFSGAEIEQIVVSAMFIAFSEHREMVEDDLLTVIHETIPLSVTMDDHIKLLREWARPRARPASVDTRRIDYFEAWDDAGAPEFHPR